MVLIVDVMEQSSAVLCWPLAWNHHHLIDYGDSRRLHTGQSIRNVFLFCLFGDSRTKGREIMENVWKKNSFPLAHIRVLRRRHSVCFGALNRRGTTEYWWWCWCWMTFLFSHTSHRARSRRPGPPIHSSQWQKRRKIIEKRANAKETAESMNWMLDKTGLLRYLTLSVGAGFFIYMNFLLYILFTLCAHTICSFSLFVIQTGRDNLLLMRGETSYMLRLPLYTTLVRTYLT